MEERIRKLAAALGDAAEEEQELLGLLCRRAAEELKGRLRAEVSPEDCESAFVAAAAWMALDGLEAGRGVNGVEQFSAGDLTIRTGKGKAGGGLYAQAMRLMGPYLEDDAFAFRGVRG